MEVMCRGRWASDKTLCRYCKAGKLEHLMNLVSQCIRNYALWAERNLEQVIVKNRPALLPPERADGKLPQYARPPSARSSSSRKRRLSGQPS